MKVIACSRKEQFLIETSEERRGKEDDFKTNMPVIEGTGLG